MEKSVKRFFDSNGKLKIFPRKEKDKICVLKIILKEFKPNEKYPEEIVDEILKKFYGDHCEIRRAMIDYRLMKRWNSKDGRTYYQLIDDQ